MSNVTGIHKDKNPLRRHFIKEWAEKRGWRQAELAEEGNFDKVRVHNWWHGAMPRNEYLLVLKDVFQLDDVSQLFRHPDDDWLSRFFADKTEDEKTRAINILKSAFPDRIPDIDPTDRKTG